MRAARRGGPVLAVWLLLAGGQAWPAVQASDEARHAQAVAAARAGRYAEALAVLGRLYRSHPEVDAYLYDLAAVRVWAGQGAAALQLAPRIDHYRAPRYVVAALARAARDARLYGLAEEYYRAILARWPDDVDALVGLALTLADAGEYDASRAIAAALTRSHPQLKDAWYARAYVNERAGDHVRAAAAYQALLERWPGERRAAVGLVVELLAAGAVERAREVAAAHRERMPAELMARLAADVAAVNIRWGELPPPSEAERFAGTDRALARLDAACGGCDWWTLDLGVTRNRRLVFDRMVALRDRVRMDEVLRHYRQLREAGIEPPAYALLAAGDAALYLREPELAERLYRRVLEKDPESYNARLSLFYALVELERFDEALAVIDALVATEPEWRRTRDGRHYRENPRRFAAELAAVEGRAFADDLAGALVRLERLLAFGPENTDLRSARASVWRWRGWEERAWRAFVRLIEQEPTLLSARIGAAEAALDLQRFREAEQRIRGLVARFPENLHVQRAARRWRLHEAWELAGSVGFGRSTGGTFGSSEWLGELWLYTPPIAYDWRLFFHDRYDEARFAEGLGQNHRPGLGLEYRHRRWRAAAEVSAGDEVNTRLGLAASVDYRLDDHWRLGGVAELNSMQTPLRAQNAGVRGHRLGASVVYRWHESQRAAAGLDFIDMSDGNHRYAANGSFARRLISRPHWKLEGTLGAYASHNTREGVIYYNPANDLALEGSFDSLWVMYRRYEQSYAHRLVAGTGGYWQEGFSSGWTWTIRYQHEWKFSDRLSLIAGFQRARRVYDGTPELQTRYFASFNARL